MDVLLPSNSLAAWLALAVELPIVYALARLHKRPPDGA